MKKAEEELKEEIGFYQFQQYKFACQWKKLHDYANEKGIEIKNIDKVSDDIVVFHAGTALKDGKLVTNGGRVLNVCARGANLQEALAKVYETATIITFDGMYYRHDIGLR